MGSKEEFDDPELPPVSGSELEAVMDLGAIGVDGVPRPFLINQCGEESLAITVDDAERLMEFLKKGIDFVNEAKRRITQ